jgi:starch synthase
MKILFVSSEVVPYIKTGGLADVSGALPKELIKRGHDVRIILPEYSKIDSQKFNIESCSIEYSIPNFDYKAEIEKTVEPVFGMIIYFVKCDPYYAREELYDDYKDNAERFIFFGKAVLELLKYIDWTPDIIHCNDWQTGIVPALLKNAYNQDNLYQNIRTLFTIHNMAYQGVFPQEEFKFMGLPDSLFNLHALEYWGQICLLKAGLVYSDIINTVSETYAKEIQTSEFGWGLEGVLSERQSDLYGILNGIDYEIWDPRIDSYIWYNYDENSLDRKLLNKQELQKECQLPQIDVPIIGIISRLVDQKGFDLIEEIIDELMQLDFQLILAGTGTPRYHQLFTQIKENYPQKSAIYFKFDDQLAHKIEAGADFFLMPSRFEPCGLNQLISLRYGTIPIVRKIGGLADSVIDIDSSLPGVGFVFNNYDGQELLQKIKRALAFYTNTKRRITIIKHGMQKDFSWAVSAQKYEQLYQKAFQKNKL